MFGERWFGEVDWEGIMVFVWEFILDSVLRKYDKLLKVWVNEKSCWEKMIVLNEGC